MTSPAQAAANRRNAAGSTGPRSAVGKARAAANALRHGLTASRATLRCEDREAWARLRADLVARFQPEGEAEAGLLDDLAFHYLRLGRLPLAEAGAWNAYWQEDVWPKQPYFGEVVEGLAHETIGFGVAVKAGVMAELCRLTLYEQRIRRAIEKSRAELGALQQARRWAAAQAENEGAAEASRLDARALLDGLEAVERARDAEPAPRREVWAAPPPAPAEAAAPAARRKPGQLADEDWLAKDLIPPQPRFAPAPPAAAADPLLAGAEAFVRAERQRLAAEAQAFAAAQAAEETATPTG